jgi:pimeloyl-ACP methyl ester carboxylesterase
MLSIYDARMAPILKHSRSEFIAIRHQRYHVRHWGTPQTGQLPLVMLHGWMDVSASFQFVVDALQRERWVIAPDWRGYGLTTGPATDHYWFTDYLADLDFLLDHYAADTPVDLLGHSMGGNVAMVYAGARPQRVHRLVNLEGFGLPTTQPAQAPSRYAKWMDELKAHQRGEMALRAYPDAAGVAQRLMKTNPRLAPDKAAWLAQHWAAPDAQGQWRVLGDAAHKITHPYLFQEPEMLACYRRITAPLLMVEAQDNALDSWFKGSFTLAQFHERLKAVPQVQKAVIANTGHMLHHDQPEQLAQLLEGFLGAATI